MVEIWEEILVQQWELTRGPLGAAIGGQLGREIGDRVEDFIRDFIDREPQTKEPQAPREPIRDFYDYGYSFGHAW
ncbi:hypothetical protein AOH207_12310 [Helicobacter pylori]